MVVTFPEIRVGPPVRHQALSVFPLFTDPYGPVEYLLSDEALADGSVTVTEVSEAGSVPDLLVENKGERRVLFLEGWEEVARQQCALGAFSASMAMSDTFQAHEQHMADFREKLKYVEGAAGVAVAIHERVVALDLFDKPSTCRKVWDRLLSGFVLDALEAEETPRQAEVADVDRLLQGFGRASWQQAEAVGEGAEHRTEFGQAAHASVLSLDGSLVHGSVVAAG
jgi:hypothetical protein